VVVPDTALVTWLPYLVPNAVRLARSERFDCVITTSGPESVHLAGFPVATPWILWSVGLYLLAGAAWLPVVWMQIRMRNMAATAAASGADLSPEYWRLLRLWVGLGIVAFAALVAVFYLMVAKPAL